jgi:hypothetical protein
VTRTRDSNCHRHFSFIDSLILITCKIDLYRLFVDVLSMLFRADAKISLILLNTRFLKLLSTYSEKVVLFIQHQQSSTSSWSEIDKTTIERRLRNAFECTSTRLLEKKLVKISRTQVWLIRWAKERVARAKRRRFDISCKTWSICENENYTDNEKSKLWCCVRSENESWCAMTAIDYSREYRTLSA